METLPIVSFILWTTGVCTALLAGFAIKDALSAQARPQPTLQPLPAGPAAPRETAPAAAERPLLKAA